MAEEKQQKNQSPARRENADMDKASPSVEHAAPRVRRKESITFEHTLVKLEVSMMKKNVGFKEVAKRQDIHDVEHTHFFHSHDDRGIAQKYSSAVGGHFHEVTIDWSKADENGDPLIKVGPPIVKERKLNNRGNMTTRYSTVTFQMEDAAGDAVTVQDDHGHKATYKHTETLRPKVRNLQQINVMAPTQPKDATITEV